MNFYFKNAFLLKKEHARKMTGFYFVIIPLPALETLETNWKLLNQYKQITLILTIKKISLELRLRDKNSLYVKRITSACHKMNI